MLHSRWKPLTSMPWSLQAQNQSRPTPLAESNQNFWFLLWAALSAISLNCEALSWEISISNLSSQEWAELRRSCLARMRRPLNTSRQLTALTVEPAELHIKANSKCQVCSMSSKKHHKSIMEEFRHLFYQYARLPFFFKLYCHIAQVIIILLF